MPHSLTALQEKTLLALFPTARTADQPLEVALGALLDAESARRGAPDPVTGAFHRLALTEGPLLKEEYDHGTHSFGAGFCLGAVVVDPVQLIRVNMRYGFAAGDQVLRAIASTVQAACPKAKVVRLSGACFGALLGPTAEQAVSDALPGLLRPRLDAAVAGALPDDGEPKLALQWTVALLQLVVARPSHSIVLGPLTFAECDRARLLERREGPLGVQRRSLDLQGGV